MVLHSYTDDIFVYIISYLCVQVFNVANTVNKKHDNRQLYSISNYGKGNRSRDTFMENVKKRLLYYY